MARAPAEPPELPADISMGPMRRRHVRDVLAIERSVYPRPWSAALFFSVSSTLRAAPPLAPAAR